MGRNSVIDREMLGSTVLDLHASGQTHGQIAASLSVDRNENFSKQQVQRYVNRNTISDERIVTMRSGAVVDERTRDMKMLVASILGAPDPRDTTTSEYYGAFSVNTKNVFDGYYNIARGGISGLVTRSFKNLALKLTNGLRIVTDEAKQNSANDLMKYIKFKSLTQNVARSQFEMGTAVVLLKDMDDNLTKPKISPMSYLTLLTDKEKIGSINKDLLIHGDITQIVHDESGDNQIVYDRDDVGLFQIWSDDNYFVDILGRNTYGIYGESMVPEVKVPLKSMLNAGYNFDRFLARYGSGRMHKDLRMVAEMLKEGLIDEDKATEYLKKESAAQQKIKANTDVISVGQDISMIETKHGFDITKFMAYRANEISQALLQSDVSMGKVGSQFTNAGGEVSKHELEALQSFRDTFYETVLNELVSPYLPQFNLKIEDISIVAEPLNTIHVNTRDLIEMEGTGNITQGELRLRNGFSEHKPEVKL